VVAAVKRVLIAGVVLLGAAWALAPAPSPPLYDGAVGPAQNYLYLQPPPGHQQSGPPKGASRILAIVNGSSGAGFVNTEETPPQAQVLAADGTFSFPAGAKSIILTVAPVAPPATPIPALLGTPAGNVYQVTAQADVPGPVTVNSGHPMTVVLRGPAGVGNAPIARLTEGATAWERAKTVPLGSAPDMVVTNTDALGWFVITSTAAGGSSTSSGGGGSGGGSSGGGFPVIAVVIPAVVVLAVIAVLLLARSGPGKPPPRRR
jgi:hypothetical protein